MATSGRHTYSDLGDCYFSTGQYDKALEHNKIYLDTAKQIKDKAAEGNAYCNIGNCYQSLARYDKALKYHTMHLDIAKQIDDKAGKGRAYGNLGNCYFSLGQYDKALEFHMTDLNITEQIYDKAGTGSAYCNIGNCYYALGQYDKALEHHKMYLNIAKQIGDKAGEGRAIDNLGICYHSLGQYDTAVKHHILHLNIAKEIQDKAGEGRAYGDLGKCYYSLGQYEKALDHHKMYLNIAKQIGDKAGEGRAYGDLGKCYYSLGQYEKALDHHKMYLNIAKQIGDKAGEGCAYGNLGNYYHSLGQYDKATKVLGNCLQCREELFRNVPREDQYKTSIRDIFIGSERLLVRTLLSQNKTEEALVVAEKGRSRALAELMMAILPGQSTEEYRETISDFCDIQDVVNVLGSTVIFLTLLEHQLCTWVLQPNEEVIFKEATVEVTSPQTKLTGALWEPYKDPLSSKSQAIVQQAGTFGIEILNREAVREITEGRNRNNEPLSNKPLEKLYEIILKPVRQFVKGSQVVVIPDGPLSLVPFAALVDEDGKYVAESLQVRLVPSLATAKMIADYPNETDVQATPLIVGDPHVHKLRNVDVMIPVSRMPGAKIEAERIGKLLNVEPMTGQKGTKEAVIQRLSSANLIHIAAHGDMKRGEILLAPNPSHPRDAVRKEDVMLTPSDLEHKCVRAKLVVLSCCHTAQGEVKAEGIIGIARAFLGAGAHAVLVTLCAIHDMATLYFMEEFYKNLIDGMRAGEALQKTTKTMMESDEYYPPRYWAAFALIGADVAPFAVS